LDLLEVKSFSDNLRERLGIKDNQIPGAIINTGGYAMGMMPQYMNPSMQPPATSVIPGITATPGTSPLPPAAAGAASPSPPPAAGAAAPRSEPKEPKKHVVKEKSFYNVKITAFDATKKLSVIKELRTLVPDLSLVKAKQLVEEAPSLIKEKIAKESAQNFKEKLEAAGATVALE